MKKQGLPLVGPRGYRAYRGHRSDLEWREEARTRVFAFIGAEGVMHRVSQLYSFFFFSLNEVLFIFKMFIEVESCFPVLCTVK